MNTLHVKTGDTVEVLSGKEKGKRGKIMKADPKKGLVIIEGLNIMTKHQKARKQGEQDRQGRGRSESLQGHPRLPQVQQDDSPRP